jgi:hypothetical protein
MNYAGRPGVADPCNPLVPFGRFDGIHFARFVVLVDNTLEDRSFYPGVRDNEPTYLCFMVDCDGSASELLSRIARECSRLRDIFAYCADFTQTSDLAGWMQEHRVRPSTSYVNWVGRTVPQVHWEAELHRLLLAALPHCRERDPQRLFAELRACVEPPPNPPAPLPTPLSWRLRQTAHLLTPIIIAAMCLLLFPLITLVVAVFGLIIFLIVLRRHEQSDWIISKRPSCANVVELRKGEDYDVTNQYTAIGSLKPGRFRLGLEIAVLYALDWAARHICTRGRLGRIGTIHFAHWVLLDGRRRGLFCSYYDGGHEPYMDDFINKAGFGLNLSFSSAIGYPQTDWLIKKGAWREQEFKHFQRRHQIPTDVWYKAYPGLTTRDLARNSRIRNGFEKTSMSDDEIRRWLSEI